MTSRTTLHRFGLASIAVLGLAATAWAAPPDTLKKSELVSLSGEVVAIDAAGRHVTLRGPLGGEVSGKVSADVKNLDLVKVGDLVTISYYESMAVSAKRKGESTPIFTGSNTAAAPGELPGGYVTTQSTEVWTVLSADAKARSLVVQGVKGNVTAIAVQRPEFVSKLAELKPGDQLEVVRTEAYIVDVARAQPGAKPSMSRNVTTLVVDHGEVVRRLNNTIFVRNEKGKILKVVVDPDFKFMLDGKEATVYDLKPGAKLTRTALRVVESVEYEAP